jgi:hypothetical protein
MQANILTYFDTANIAERMPAASPAVRISRPSFTAESGSKKHFHTVNTP